MWTKENRVRYNRDKLRYPSDLIDAEWSLIEPLIPPAKGWRQQAPGEPSRDTAQRDHVCALDGMPMAGDSERPAAEEHGVRLSRFTGSMTAPWIACTTRFTSVSRASLPRHQPYRRDHRQSEREKRRRGGLALIHLGSTPAS